MFKRRKGGSDPAQADESVEQVDEVIVEEVVTTVGGLTGPFDISAAPSDEIARVDLGGLQIPIVDNMQLHLEGHDEVLLVLVDVEGGSPDIEELGAEIGERRVEEPFHFFLPAAQGIGGWTAGGAGGGAIEFHEGHVCVLC